jgi:uncharacterized protein YdeI (YjbR/CyaY-like superfamily)
VSKYKGLEVVEVPDRAAWRLWLESNHASSPGVWLVFHKKNSAGSSQSYDEAIEEALAYGWIDSTTNRLDDDRYIVLLTPRKPGSVWARTNKARVDRLIAEGRMAEAGLAKVEAAKRDGSWTSLDDVEDLVIADDLAAAFSSNPTAWRNYQAFPESAKKQLLYYVYGVKRPETRARRIEEAVRLARDNVRPLEWRTRRQDPRRAAEDSSEGSEPPGAAT